MNGRRLALRLVLAGLAALSAARGAHAQGWSQGGSGPEHQGATAAAGQALTAMLTDLLYDPFALETAETGGSLLVHYSVPLLDGSSAYIGVQVRVVQVAYVVAVHPDLTPAWSASLRNVLNDGCDVGFGWDITPAVYPHGGTYSILMKDNHYEIGSYCFDPAFCPAEMPRYDFVSLDPNLSVEWKFRNTNTFTCKRESNGEVTCVSNQPNGFEWCINQPGVDVNGVAYANSEDGFLYAIGPDGTLAGRIFLDRALGAAYTPLAISADGLIYAQNNGHLFVVGNPLRPPASPVRKTRATRSVKPR